MKKWFIGLLNAFFGGGASAFLAATIDPQVFNVHDGLKNIGGLFILNGVTHIASYLQRSPIPSGDTTEFTRESLAAMEAKSKSEPKP